MPLIRFPSLIHETRLPPVKKEKWKFNWGKFTGSLKSWTRVAALLNEPRSIQKKLNDLNLFELIKYPLKLKFETSDISSGAQCQLFKSLHQPKQSAKKTIKKKERNFFFRASKFKEEIRRLRSHWPNYIVSARCACASDNKDHLNFFGGKGTDITSVFRRLAPTARCRFSHQPNHITHVLLGSKAANP